jgi:hypothetical protein
MQKKAIFISFVVVVLFWIGAMVSKHVRQSEENAARNERMYEKRIKISKNSPRSGLGHMGRVLNTYYADKGVYPERLMDLYPEYIASKSFLTEIQWDYKKSGNNNFSLKKTIIIENTKRITVVDKDLRVEEMSSIAVAQSEQTIGSDETSEEELGVMVTSPVPIQEPEKVASVAVEMAGETGQEEKVSKVSSEMIASAPKIVTVINEDIAPGIDSKIGRVFLVWKDEKGRLGFGNVDYPSSYTANVYSNGRYQSIRRPAPLGKSAGFSDRIKQHKSKDEIASNQSSQSLVWKNKDGTMGFGNVDYPKGNDVSHININGTWAEKRKIKP